MKNALYSPIVCLNINFSSGPTSIMKSSFHFFKEPWYSGTFLSLNPWSFVKWIIYYWIIYCSVRKQEIWSKTNIFSHLFFSCGKSFCTLAWVYKVDFCFCFFFFLTLNTFYSVFKTSEVIIIFVHQRGQSCNIFLAFGPFFPFSATDAYFSRQEHSLCVNVFRVKVTK